MESPSLKTWLLKLITYAILITIVIVTLIPLYWMITASFKPQSELFSFNQSWYPQTLFLDNYTQLYEATAFGRWMFNSLFVTVGTTVLGLAVCAMAGFAFAKYDFKFKNILFAIAFAPVTVPQVVTIIPVFSWLSRLGLTDTYFALIVPQAINVFAMFLLRQYISSLPDELLESARIDGLSEWGIFWRIVLPVVKPGMGAAAIFLCVQTWSAYMWPLIMSQTSKMFTIPLGLATMYANPWDLNYGLLMAGAVLSTLPVVILFLLMQEQFISGLTQGAIKG